MIVIYSNDHEAAPLLEDPLEEHNVDRSVRPVYKKIRKVKGKTGWLLRRYGHFFGAPKGDGIGLGHHAIQVGLYVYEMTREKGLVGQRLTGDQIWPSTVGEMVMGYTDMTDEDIQLAAVKAQAVSRSRNGGKYHIKYNNCQHFISDLERRIITTNETPEPAIAIPGGDIVTYSAGPSSLHSLSRHDSVVSKPEPVLKIRESTFAPLRASAMELYARQNMVKVGGTVNVVTTSVTVTS